MTCLVVSLWLLKFQALLAESNISVSIFVEILASAAVQHFTILTKCYGMFCCYAQMYIIFCIGLMPLQAVVAADTSSPHTTCHNRF